MIENDAQLAPDPAWWTAPLVATLLGLPLLVWALPRRRSARMLRITAACSGLVCALLPLLFVVLMGMALASG